MFEKSVFIPGKVVFNTFDDQIWNSFSPENESLSEDMLQVIYDNDIILDIGWHSRLERFIIHIIKGQDWMNPIEKRLCPDIVSLERNLLECIDNVKLLL